MIECCALWLLNTSFHAAFQVIDAVFKVLTFTVRKLILRVCPDPCKKYIFMSGGNLLQNHLSSDCDNFLTVLDFIANDLAPLMS